MKLNKTMIKEDLDRLDGKCLNLFGECFTVLNVLRDLKEIMVTEEEYNTKHEAIEDFEYYQLDVLEQILEINVGTTIDIFIKAVGSKDACTHRRLRMFQQEFAGLKAGAEKYSMAYLPLMENELNDLEDSIVECLGQITYYMYYQFGMDIFMKGFVEDADELEVDINMFNYCDKAGLEITKTAVMIDKTRQENKPTLPVFDEIPELEEAFYELVGAHVKDFEKLETKLTVSDVKFMLDNKDLEVQSFLDMVEKRL